MIKSRCIRGLLTCVLGLPGLSYAAPRTTSQLPEATGPVVRQMVGLKGVVGWRGALAIPSGFGPNAFEGENNSRALSAGYGLTHTFEDGSGLAYSGYFEGNSTSLYVQHGISSAGEDYSAELMSFEDRGEGYASHSLTFYEGDISGDEWRSSGRALWGASLDGGENSDAFLEAQVSTFSTYYDIDEWGYKSEDFTYALGDSYRYEGGGSYGIGDVDQSYYSQVEVTRGGTPYALCETEGKLLSESSGGTGFSSETQDNCIQLEEGGLFWESWIYSANTYVDGKGWESTFTQEIICSSKDGGVLRYTWQGDSSTGYLNTGTGEIVDYPACGWDPTAEL